MNNNGKTHIIKPSMRVRCCLYVGMVFVMILIGCNKDADNQSAQKKMPLVLTDEVRIGNIAQTIDMTAEVVPIESVTISSTSEGPIAYCPWREGDHVEAEQKLIEISREMYRAEVKAAEAALIVAQAKLLDLKAGTRPEEIAKAIQNVRETEQSAEFEKSNLDRVSELVRTGALPGEEMEKSRVKYVAAETKMNVARKQLEMLEAGFTSTTVAVQEALVKEAEAKLDLARTRLNECVITAPFTGTITRVYARQGDMASAKAPLLQMADLDSLVIRCFVPEQNSTEVHTGLTAQVRLDALPGKILSAEVVRVYPQLDPRMRTRTIELNVKEKADLTPGMFGRVRLTLESATDAVIVPVQSVIVSPRGAHLAYVFSDGKAVQRKVQTGIEERGLIQIISGLSAGEKVIVSGQEKLKDGVGVRVPPSPAEGGAKGKSGEKSGGNESKDSKKPKT